MAAQLVFIDGHLTGRTVALEEEIVGVGREPGLAVAIPAPDDRYVSRRHARLERQGGSWFVVDEGSRNGTFVNGERIERAEIHDRDVIQFGRSGPRARFDEDPDRTVAMSEDGATAVAPRIAAGGSPDEPERDRAAAASASAAPASPARGATAEGVTQYVNRLVEEKVRQAKAASAGTRRGVLAAAGLAVLALAMATGVFVRSDEEVLAGWAERYEGSVFLIEIGIRTASGYQKLSNGTGFAVGDGLIVTNKHVAAPHRYFAENACIQASFQRRRLDYDEALVITAWPGGTAFRQNPANRAGDRSLGYSTEQGTLELVALAGDQPDVSRQVRCQDFFDGSSFSIRWLPHPTDNNDLAVLEATAEFPAIPVAEAEPEPDSPVLVLGFPSGVGPLETNDAVPLARTGKVLRVQETIQIDAPVLHGNSGGPLINARGEVIGVTTRGPSDVLNMALKVEYVRPLIDRAR